MNKLRRIIILGLSLGVSVSIMYLNWSMIRPQFEGVWTANLGSIEVSYIQMARFIEKYGLWGVFNPSWYFGYPMYLLYVPVLPVLEWLLVRVGEVGYGQAYRLITGFAYILVPVSVFWFGRGLFGLMVEWDKKVQSSKFKVQSDRGDWITSLVSILVGMVAALWYSVMPSVFAWLVKDVAGDRMTLLWEPRRLAIWARWGEGPHTLGLVWLPLAMLFSLEAVITGSSWSLVAAAVFGSLTLLTNAIAVEALVVWWGLLAVLAYGLLGKKLRIKGLVCGILVIIFSLMWSAWWYHPDFVKVFFSESKGMVNMAKDLFPWGWLGIVIVVGFGLWVMRRINGWLNLPFLMIMGWAGVMFVVVAIYYWSDDKKELLPQALRLTTESDMGLGLVVAVMVGWMTSLGFRGEGLGARVLLYKIISVVAVLGAVVGSVLMIGHGMKLAPEMRKAVVGYQGLGTRGEGLVEDRILMGTNEYRVAEWASREIKRAQPEWSRVVVPGNYGFYWNWFSPIPQLRGALFQSSVHPWPDHIYYQLTNGKDGEISRLWMEATETEFLVYGDARTGEIYKDYRKVTREKFDDNLERIAGFGGSEDDAIETVFRLPEPAKLGRVVDLGQMEDVVKPAKGDDRKSLVKYVEWMKSAGGEEEVKVVEKSSREYVITAKVKENQGLRIAMSWTPGWRATGKSQNSGSRNQKLKVMEDPLGFVVVEPKEIGDVEVVLKHGVTMWQWIGLVTSCGSLVMSVWYLLWGKQMSWEKDFKLRDNWIETEVKIKGEEE